MAKGQKVSERLVKMLGRSRGQKGFETALRHSYVPLIEEWPTRLGNMIERSREYHESKKAEPAFWHAYGVLRDSVRHDMTEVWKIQRANRAEINLHLATIMMYHTLRNPKSRKAGLPVQDIGRYKIVTRGLQKFSQLRELDLSGAPPERYVKLLEKPSLALLARMVDLLPYSDFMNRNKEAEKQLSSLDPSLFYVYESKHGSEEYRRIAIAAERVYAPFADLLGYRTLAGEMHEMAYKILDYNYWSEVHGSLYELRERIMNTQNFCQKLVKKTSRELERMGFELKITIRPQKHAGKIMRKVDERGLLTRGTGVFEAVSSLKDLVACKLVLIKKRKKQVITKKDLYEAVEVVKNKAKEMAGKEGMGIEKADVEHKNKPNGYESIHVDISFSDRRYVPLEAIVRDEKMDNFAEQGGAAHFLYKGGRDALHRKLLHVYGDFLNALDSGKAAIIAKFDLSHCRDIRLDASVDGKQKSVTLPGNATIADAVFKLGVRLSSNFSITQPPGAPMSLFAQVSPNIPLVVSYNDRIAFPLPPGIIDSVIRTCVLPETAMAFHKASGRKNTKK